MSNTCGEEEWQEGIGRCLFVVVCLFGNTNDSAGAPSTSVASGQRVAVSTLAKVVFVGVDDKSTSNHRVDTDERHNWVVDAELCLLGELEAG